VTSVIKTGQNLKQTTCSGSSNRGAFPRRVDREANCQRHPIKKVILVCAFEKSQFTERLKISVFVRSRPQGVAESDRTGT
ncbi:hypothetical protein, partial [Tolypothrix sp. VBCCA 56010]|uniref:hypothetical protein n=1 Tax=Tolypothrix sp. VBCCA 56010 TaxID=3137731 RepID=UPI003D7D02BC